MPLRDVKLDDKYDLGHSRVFVTGFQALVRLCLMQKELDRRNGLRTGGFVTGYRGSPLGISIGSCGGPSRFSAGGHPFRAGRQRGSGG